MSEVAITVIGEDGRTTIPASVRKKYGINTGDRIKWLDEGDSCRVEKVEPLPRRK